MDFLTILGLFSGIGVVYYVMARGEITALLFNLDAFLLVFGGTFASTIITYPWSIMKMTPAAALLMFRPPKRIKPKDLIERMVALQNINISRGVDVLLNEMNDKDDSFLKYGVRMLVEDNSSQEINENMSNELSSVRQRHSRVISVFRSMGAYSPIFGLLGTLIGVVQVLKNLSDTNSMGQSMAIAVTTTFYGIFGCNFIFLPIAGKLDGYSNEELTMRELVIVGILAMRERTLPSLMQRKMERFLSEQSRLKA